MRYVIKVGGLYVTADGGLSSSQADALKVDTSDVPGHAPRAVSIVPAGTFAARRAVMGTYPTPGGLFPPSSGGSYDRS